MVIGHNPGDCTRFISLQKSLIARVDLMWEDYHPGEGKDKLVQQLTRS
ncbi:MAG: hypothetical protein M9898_05215 [Chitinophagaceae bacterium]|nr:hypothetical protein [Chitinophagaceae bacterium]